MGCNCGKGSGVSVAALKKAAPVELPKIPKVEEKPATLLDKAKGVLNAVTDMSSQETQNKRMAVCDKCPNLLRLTGNCMKCGCFVALKVKFQASSCPVGKW